MPPGSLNHEPDKNCNFYAHPFFSIMKGVKTREGTPLYNPYRYVSPLRVGFLGLFGPKRLCPFWSGIGYGFLGNYGSVHVIFSF